MSGWPRSFVCHVGEAIPNAFYIGPQVRERYPHSILAPPNDARGEEKVRALLRRALRNENMLYLINTIRDRPLECWCRYSIQTTPLCHGDGIVAIQARFAPANLRAISQTVATRGFIASRSPQGITLLDTEEAIEEMIFQILHPE